MPKRRKHTYTSVENQKAKGVDVKHPSIVKAVKNASARGYSTEKISELTGMPYTVVQDIQREHKGESVDKGYPG